MRPPGKVQKVREFGLSPLAVVLTLFLWSCGTSPPAESALGASDTRPLSTVVAGAGMELVPPSGRYSPGQIVRVHRSPDKRIISVDLVCRSSQVIAIPSEIERASGLDLSVQNRRDLSARLDAKLGPVLGAEGEASEEARYTLHASGTTQLEWPESLADSATVDSDCRVALSAERDLSLVRAVAVASIDATVSSASRDSARLTGTLADELGVSAEAVWSKGTKVGVSGAKVAFALALVPPPRSALEDVKIFLQVISVDDAIQCSAMSGSGERPLATVLFAEPGKYDITAALKRGPNTLRCRASDKQAGACFSYNFKFLRNQDILDDGASDRWCSGISPDHPMPRDLDFQLSLR